MSEGAIYERPVFFRRNRVFRVYQGGALFHELMGDEAADGNEPEEWIASTVRAINPGHTDPLEGVSITESGEPFPELLQRYPREMLGGRESLGVLVKFLDSAIRLPMQVHPTRDFSRRHFNSGYGKAEAWLILATRPDASIYFGFSREVSREEFRKAVDRSETEREMMTTFVNRCLVKTGDVFFVPAGVIHAIGAGCLILEVQEPTDFTIQPEHWCGDYHLNGQEMYLGLSPETALECFDYGLWGSSVVEKSKKEPQELDLGEGWRLEQLIGPQETECFTMKRLKLLGGTKALESGAIYIATEGQGTLKGQDYQREIRKGEYFYLPFAAQTVSAGGNGLELVRCAGGK